MSLHRDIVDRMIPELASRFPGCGVLLGGSVQRHEERADSDIDLFVVFPGDGQVRLEHDRTDEGIKIDLALFPEGGFRRDVPGQWYKFWMFSRAEIVHDPTGIARRNQDTASSYFCRHRQVNRAWERQQAEVRLHRADRAYRLDHPTWDDFIHHLQRMMACD